MPNSKQIVYLSQAQYQELITNGTITVDGVTVTYDENDIYVTPQAEPVTDVRVDGTSIAANGVAEIPVASSSAAGVIKIAAKNGVQITNGDELVVTKANPSHIQTNAGVTTSALAPANAKQVAFYGLSNAAGDITQHNETLNNFTYTPEAKGAIQSMLGVSDLIATAENSLVASKAYAVGDVFTVNGKLYKATAAIAANDSIVLQNEGETVSGANAEEIKLSDYAIHDIQINGTSILSNGTVNIQPQNGYGIGVDAHDYSKLILIEATDYEMRVGGGHRALTGTNQYKATFYGLAKAAGDTTQSQSDNAVGTYTDDAKSAIKNMIGINVEDVQINNSSIVNSGIATIPLATNGVFGVTKANLGAGIGVDSVSSTLYVNRASIADIKTGAHIYKPIVPSYQHISVFYGLAMAAGDTTQSASSNAVGTYTDNAKASIKSMLGIVDGSTGTVDVSGAAPTIAAVENTRYVCGEVTSLDFTPAASGVCIVRFTSGSTPTLLTLPSTVKFPEWFDSTALETDTIYEMCITDGVYGAVMSWAL